MPKTRLESDEKYVLELVAEVLSEEYQWQKRFDTLLGDPGKSGKSIKLPVDAYFPTNNIIVEYKEKQHTQGVSIMDRRKTVSGVLRGEQRAIYDARKEKWAKDEGYKFLVIQYSDLDCKATGRLMRNSNFDKIKIQNMINLL